MKVILQRVKDASVNIKDKTIANINSGLLILVGFTNGDNINDIEYIVNKIINLRIFDDNNGIMNLSIKDIKGSILSISQFTLYADTKKGRRPSYDNSLNKEEAIKLYNIFNNCLRDSNIMVKTGSFGEEMQVRLINDGPVTIIIDSKE